MVVTIAAISGNNTHKPEALRSLVSARYETTNTAYIRLVSSTVIYRSTGVTATCNGKPRSLCWRYSDQAHDAQVSAELRTSSAHGTRQGAAWCAVHLDGTNTRALNSSNVPYLPHPCTKKYLCTYVMNQQMHSDKYALSRIDIHILVSAIRVLYKKYWWDTTAQFVLSILP